MSLLAPDELVAQVAELLSQQETLAGVLDAVDFCLEVLSLQRVENTERTVLLTSFLLRFAAELILNPQRTVPAALTLLLARDRGRQGGAALAQRYATEERRFQPPADGRATRVRPPEPASLPDSDRALIRRVAESRQELKAIRYEMATEWLRLKDDFFPRTDELDPHEQMAAWLLFQHWETRGVFPEMERPHRWHDPPAAPARPPAEERVRPRWTRLLPKDEWSEAARADLVWSSPATPDPPPECVAPRTLSSRAKQALLDQLIRLSQEL
jgi:hypothetical protein